MKYDTLPILICHVEEGDLPVDDKRKVIAQTTKYPVMNGTGTTVDEAVEDLLMHILQHLHDRKWAELEYRRL